MVTRPQVFAHDGEHRRQPESTRGEDDGLSLPVGLDVAGTAQRTGDAREGVPDGHLVDFDAARAHALDDEADRARFRVPVGQGEGDEFAVGSGQHAHELARAGGVGDERCVDRELLDAVGEVGLAEDPLRGRGALGELPRGPHHRRGELRHASGARRWSR